MLASLVAGRLRVPGLLLFLFLGMAIGSDGLGLIDFSDYRLARRIGQVIPAMRHAAAVASTSGTCQLARHRPAWRIAVNRCRIRFSATALPLEF